MHIYIYIYTDIHVYVYREYMRLSIASDFVPPYKPDEFLQMRGSPQLESATRQDTTSKGELFSRFELAQLDRAIQETGAQPLPDDLEDVQELLKEEDESENTSLLASSRVAGVVLGRSTVEPQQQAMHTA